MHNILKNFDTIILKCAECGKYIEVGRANDAARCKRCGATELLVESDEVVVEQIKIERIQQSPLTGIMAMLHAGTLIVALYTFMLTYHIAAIIMLFASALFLSTFLIRKRIKRISKNRIHSLLPLLAILLIIPYIFFRSENYEYQSDDKYVWVENELTALIPKPKSGHGKITWDDNERFSIKVSLVLEMEYYTYVDECIKRGFTIEPDNVKGMYRAYNDSGMRVTVQYFSHTAEMAITVEKKNE